jgi:uncharacterized membrane protein SirB2
MSVESFAASLQATSLSDALKDASWVVPTMQSVHIIMVGVVFVSILMISLRMLGWMRTDESLHRVWTRFSPFLWCGIGVMAVTGTVLTIAEPVREFMTLSFRLKLILLVICVASAAAFGRVARTAASASSGSIVQPPLSAGARATVFVTLLLWVVIIFLGRAIAYDNSVWGDWSPVESLGGAAT